MNSTYDCVVFAAGEYYGNEPGTAELPDEWLVVAADGGAAHARELGVRPDIFIGDCDSYPGGASSIDADTIITLPPEHDDPDMLSALKAGWSRGARRFHIYGGLGGRTDHAIANMQLLALLAQCGGIGFLHGRDDVTCALSDGTLSFPATSHSQTGMVSVFPHGGTAREVCETGLKYELRNASLDSAAVQGVSNEFVAGRAADITVGHGTLLVVFPAGAPLPGVATEREMPESLGPLDTTVTSALAPSPR